MRRTDREMDESFALRVTDTCPYATLSMVLPDGTPYGVPVSAVRIGRCLYFHGAAEGLKAEVLAHRPTVSVCCVGAVRSYTDKFTTGYESSILRGVAVPVEDRDEKTVALRALCLRYTPENMDAFDAAMARSLSVTAVWRIDITAVTGKCKTLPPQP